MGRMKELWLEEQYEGQSLGVEVEEQEGKDGETQGGEPYDPKLIRVDPKTFSLRSIVEMIRDGDLELAPDFQRNRVWKSLQKSRLIESVLLRIPVPAFYFSADPDGKLRVVDGLQRLSTIHEFVIGGADQRGGFALGELEYLQKDLGGKRFADLDPAWTRRIFQTQIFANVIDPQTPARVKFDIFRRINTGGSPLNTQEIRHCMSTNRSRGFLKACTETSAFQKATDGALVNHLRMADREVVLRFCAFRLLEAGDQYGPATTMDSFLSEATEKLDKFLSDAQLQRLMEDFIRAMENAYNLFGRHAFRKWDGGENQSPINRALFEAWAVALAEMTWAELEPRSEAIKQAYIATLAKNPAYDRAISVATGGHLRVKLRFSVTREIARTGQVVLPSDAAAVPGSVP